MAEPVTLARPYAKAAFEAALQDRDLSGWQRMLDLLAAVVQSQKMADLLSSPAVTSARQSAILIDVCGDELTDKVRNLVSVLSGYRRLVLLPEIALQFRQLKSQQEKTLSVSISSAFELDKAMVDRLEKVLSAKWGCQIQVSSEVDKSLLGGVVIRAGDNVIDASVRGRVQKLAEVLSV